jgi:DNA replication and repair protein RecF
MGAIGDFTAEQIKKLFHTIVEQKQDEELVRGTTLWGPHRDDLIFYLNGMDLKRYGSQGQQRTGILSLKMAELQVFYKWFGEYPLLLLDDVMSELDDGRRHYLIEMVKKNEIQTIITGANIELLTEEIAKDEVFSVSEGKIITT